MRFGTGKLAPRLTVRAQEVLNAIRELADTNGRPPTREELRKALGWKSVSTVAHFLTRLKKLSLIEITPGVARGIRITEKGSDGIPILGRIVAGMPLINDQHLLGHVPEAAVRAFFKTRPDFFLQVRGRSMSGAGILDGDLVAVRQAEDAESGEIVVAYLDGETTVKQFHRDEQGDVMLESANPDFPTISVTAPDFAIQGIVVGCLRGSIP